MFDRFIRISQVKRALKAKRFEEALKLLADPLVAEERRSQQLKDRALRGIMARAKAKAGRGQFEPALSDLDLVLSAAPEFDGAASMRRGIQSDIASRKERISAGVDLLEKAREHLADGELRVAEELCRNSKVGAADPVAQATMEKLIDGRRKVADDVAGEAEAALRRDDLAQARDQFLRARSQDPEVDKSGLGRRLRVALAKEHCKRLKAARSPGELDSVIQSLAQDQSLFPGLAEEAAVAAELRRASERLAKDIDSKLRKGGVEAGLLAWDAVPGLLRETGELEPLGRAMMEWQGGDLALARGDLVAAVEAYESATGKLSTPALQARLGEARQSLSKAQAAVRKARQLAESGKLMAAREALAEVLERWHAYDPARREMEILNQQAEDREKRIRQARALAEEGRLKAASALLLELAKDEEQGREARLLLKDVQGRIELVVEGLAQVRRAMHGQSSSSEAGLRHNLARVEELAKMQTDTDEIWDLQESLKAEIAGLECLGRLAEALEQGAPETAKSAMAEALEHRSRIPPRRLDARLLDLADSVLQRAESAIGAARLHVAADWVAALGQLGEDLPDLAQRQKACEAKVQERLKEADVLIGQAREALSAGDASRAEAELGRAREIWVDCPAANRLELSIRKLTSQHDQVDEVERLATSKDYAAAERKLRDLPPTPQFLRTRIFDIKQGLAKAQGLTQGFVLRVDEGGEFLVLRSDSFTIGNVRDRWADLQILAKIAGRHARLSRSMSFHGGLEDRIIAERGDVLVNGRSVQDAVLSSGDEIGLGRILNMIYTVPSKRSLSAVLALKGGFQVAGTDHILLLKDRGRDGRILIGRGPDCHIRVPHDGPEIEIFGSQDGQIRIRSQARGEMDGRPFTGEHPVTAGAVVRCGGTSMVLQPWAPMA